MSSCDVEIKKTRSINNKCLFYAVVQCLGLNDDYVDKLKHKVMYNIANFMLVRKNKEDFKYNFMYTEYLNLVKNKMVGEICVQELSKILNCNILIIPGSISRLRRKSDIEVIIKGFIPSFVEKSDKIILIYNLNNSHYESVFIMGEGVFKLDRFITVLKDLNFENVQKILNNSYPYITIDEKIFTKLKESFEGK